MNKISFYGGVILLIVGLIFWLLKQGSPSQSNTMKAFGFEFNFSTPAFVVMAFGILLIFLSKDLPKDFMSKPKPPEGANYITIANAVYRSKWHALENGFRVAGRVCDNTTTCQFRCDNDTADDGDPDQGAPKRCIINYFCSKNPNNPVHIDVAEGGPYTLSCPN